MTPQHLGYVLGQAFGLTVVTAIVIGLFVLACYVLFGMFVNLAMVFFIPYLAVRKVFELIRCLITRGKKPLTSYEEGMNPVEQVVVDLGDAIGVITKISKKHFKKRGVHHGK